MVTRLLSRRSHAKTSRQDLTPRPHAKTSPQDFKPRPFAELQSRKYTLVTKNKFKSALLSVAEGVWNLIFVTAAKTEKTTAGAFCSCYHRGPLA
jgi:hypothetical protein